MKKLLLPTLLIMFSTLIMALLPTEAEAAIYSDTVRLHILAASDSEDDQALKLKIRDRVLEKYSELLSAGENADSALALIEYKLPEIERDCNMWLDELGYEYSAEVTLGEEWYDTRVYEDYTLPCGYYSSLRIVIGEGDGRNWWCVMYPPLCLDVATEPAGDYTDEEYKLISPSGYNVKFKILELISSIGKGKKG